MATPFSVTVYNTSNDDSWTLAMWKDFPTLSAPITIAWQAKPAIAAGSVPSPTTFKWKTTYDVFLLDPSSPDPQGTWTSDQMFDTQVGDSWIIQEDPISHLQNFENPPSQRPKATDIAVANSSTAPAKVGFGMDRNMMAVVEGVLTNAPVSATFTPTFYIGLFKNVVESQQLYVSEATTPQKVVFGAGVTHLDFTMTITPSSITLAPGYTPPVSHTLTVKVGSGAGQVVARSLTSQNLVSLLADINSTIVFIHVPQAEDHEFTVEVSTPDPNAVQRLIKQYLLKRSAVLKKNNRPWIEITPVAVSTPREPIEIAVAISIVGMTAAAIYNLIVKNTIFILKVGNISVEVSPQIPASSSARYAGGDSIEKAKLTPYPMSSSEPNGYPDNSDSITPQDMMDELAKAIKPFAQGKTVKITQM